MIKIINGHIFVNEKETTNPELIGLAILDFAEENENKNHNFQSVNLSDKFEFVEKYLNHIKKSDSLRMTFEKETLIKLICEMPNNFKPIDFVEKGRLLNITYATSYAFLKSMINFGFMSINPKTYSFINK